MQYKSMQHVDTMKRNDATQNKDILHDYDRQFLVIDILIFIELRCSRGGHPWRSIPLSALSLGAVLSHQTGTA